MNNLKHIEINIGKACNNKCIFCMSSKSELWDIKFVSLEIIKEKIEKYANIGYKSIGFLGGDISIHSDIIEIISICKKNGFININIVSNGMMFDDKNLAKKIVEAGTTRINFSIHSHLNEIEDTLIGVKGGFRRKLKAIDNFNELHNMGKLRDALSINIVLNKKNYTKIVETVLYYFFKKNIKDIRINFIRLNKDVKENWDKLKLSYSDFLPYLKKLIYLSLKYKFRLTFDTIPACIFYKIDNINYKNLIKKFLGEEQDHIVEIDHINNKENFNWKQRKKDDLKVQFPQCENCIYRESCQGVRKEYGNLYGGDEFEPIIGERKNIIQKEENNEDLNYIYDCIGKGKLDEIKNTIISLYEKDNLNENYSNLYGVFLSKYELYEKSNNVLLNLIENNKNILDIGNIYYNIAVNYVNLGDEINAEKFLEKAKSKIKFGNDKSFKKYYDDFYKTVKKCNINEFENKIEKFFKEKGEKDYKEYKYIKNIINKVN